MGPVRSCGRGRAAHSQTLARQRKKTRGSLASGLLQLLGVHRGVVLLHGCRTARSLRVIARVPISVAATDGRIRLLPSSGSRGQVRNRVRSGGHARAAARGMAPDVVRLRAPSPRPSWRISSSGTRRAVSLVSAFWNGWVASGRAAWRAVRPSSHTRAPSVVRRSHERLANLQLEPTRPTVCAIMSARRAAQLDCWTDEETKRTDHIHHHEIASGCCGRRGCLLQVGVGFRNNEHSRTAAPRSDVPSLSAGKPGHVPSARATSSIEREAC